MGKEWDQATMHADWQLGGPMHENKGSAAAVGKLPRGRYDLCSTTPPPTHSQCVWLQLGWKKNVA